MTSSDLFDFLFAARAWLHYFIFWTQWYFIACMVATLAREGVESLELQTGYVITLKLGGYINEN
jgi:hypothetical protein